MTWVTMKNVFVAFLWFVTSIGVRRGGRAACYAEARKHGERKRVCLVPASFPWTFGPYQAQMYELSLVLDEFGYEILWLMRSENSALPEGLYSSWEELKPYHPKCIDPPASMKLDHITFVGRGFVGSQDHGVYEAASVSGNSLNRLAGKYNIDAFITLLDVGQMVPTVPFEVPVVGWLPLHSPGLSKGSPDRWVINHFHAIASLSPSSAQAIQHSLPDLKVRFVPHIIQRKQMEALARKGLHYLKYTSAVAADKALIWAKEKPGQTPTIDKQQSHPNPLLSGVDNTTFFVLFQGGNYDNADRKSWDTSIQAYAKFYHKYFSDTTTTTTPSIKSHMYIHSMESYIAEADSNNREDAPPALRPLGVVLPKRIYYAGIPRPAFTLDIAQHEPEIVAALKKRANVCVHPSKVEGFGMNVVECQALGTPVLTNNHTAMGDFTKLGISISPLQYQHVSSGIGYDFAMPDVEGLAEAMGRMYEEHVLLTRFQSLQNRKEEERIQQPQQETLVAHAQMEATVQARKELQQQTTIWIDQVFSSRTVGKSFLELLDHAFVEMTRRKQQRMEAVSLGPPPFHVQPYYHVAPGKDQLDIVETDAPWTLVGPPNLKLLQPDEIQFICWALIEREHSDATVLVMPTKYEDTGKLVEIVEEDGAAHSDLTAMIRTYLLTGLQNQVSRRRSILHLAVQHGEATNSLTRMPFDLAVLEQPKQQVIRLPDASPSVSIK